MAGRGRALTPHSKFLDYAEIVGEEYKKLGLDSGQRELKNRLEVLLAKIDNRKCADCGRSDPRWANTHLGLFFCIDCSSAHRNLHGKKIEKSQNLIKSVHRDVWTPSQVESMEMRGNKKGNEYFEAALPALPPEKRSKPKEDDLPTVKANYIKQKYHLKLYTPENIEEILAVPTTQSTSTSTEEPPVVPQDVLEILEHSKQHNEKTDLEKLLQERFDQYEEEVKAMKERRKREEWNRERIMEVKQQTTELSRLNIMKKILERQKITEKEKNERVSLEYKRELEERRERIERRKERLAESEKRRWEAVRRAAIKEAEKEREKRLLLGRDVTENPYTIGITYLVRLDYQSTHQGELIGAWHVGSKNTFYVMEQFQYFDGKNQTCLIRRNTKRTKKKTKTAARQKKIGTRRKIWLYKEGRCTDSRLREFLLGSGIGYIVPFGLVLCLACIFYFANTFFPDEESSNSDDTPPHTPIPVPQSEPPKDSAVASNEVEVEPDIEMIENEKYQEEEEEEDASPPV